MDSTYQFTYPCKTISNFYDNFRGKHIYDEIKEITFRKAEITNENRDLYDCFLLFQVIYTLPLQSTWENYSSTYSLLTGKSVSDEYKAIVSEIDQDLFEGLFSFAEIEKRNFKEAFLIDLYLQNSVSKMIGYSVLLPASLKQECDAITDKKIGKYFLKSWFSMLFKPRRHNLKEEVIEKYKNEKHLLPLDSIEEIYLFGSVCKSEYCDTSDIDMIIKFKERTTLEEMFQIKEFYSRYNKENFGRKTDIQDYCDFILSHDVSKAVRLV